MSHHALHLPPMPKMVPARRHSRTVFAVWDLPSAAISAMPTLLDTLGPAVPADAFASEFPVDTESSDAGSARYTPQDRVAQALRLVQLHDERLWFHTREAALVPWAQHLQESPQPPPSPSLSDLTICCPMTDREVSPLSTTHARIGLARLQWRGLPSGQTPVSRSIFCAVRSAALLARTATA